MKEDQYDDSKDIGAKDSALNAATYVHIQNDSTKDSGTRKSSRVDATYDRKPNNDHVIEAMGSKEGRTYKRMNGGGQGVNKTTLVSYPPTTMEMARAEAAARSDRMQKAKGKLEKAQKKEDAERLRKVAIEKARAEAAERAEQKRKKKEAHEVEEARQREEAERKECERQQILSKQRDEEGRNRRTAKEAEQKRLVDEENRKMEEHDRTQQDQISELERRIKECEDAVVEHDEMKRCKKELKDMPRGSKDRLAKMKEINQAQQMRGEARKATEAAKSELEACRRSK